MAEEVGAEQVVDQDLVVDVAREVLGRAAPEELPLLRSASRRYFETPHPAGHTRRGESEVLGFGTEAVVTLLTPVVLAVVTDVLSHIATEIAAGVGPRGMRTARAALRRLFRLKPVAPQTEEPDVPAVTSAQLALIRRNAFGRGVALGLPEEMAQRLADAVVGSMLSSDD